MGPFVKGLCFFFRPAIALFRYMSFFSLKSFANHKSGLFPIFLPKKNVYWKFQGEPETCFLPSNLESHHFKLILRLRFCQFICICALWLAGYADDAPTVAWTLSGSLSSAAAARRARACGSSKCPPPAKIEPGLGQENHVETLSFNFFLSSSSMCVCCMHAAS